MGHVTQAEMLDSSGRQKGVALVYTLQPAVQHGTSLTSLPFLSQKPLAVFPSMHTIINDAKLYIVLLLIKSTF